MVQHMVQQTDHRLSASRKIQQATGGTRWRSERPESTRASTILPKDDDARTWYRVRYIDPDTGRTVKKTIDRALRTRADREDYACKLSDQLARRRLELESGAPRATGTAFADGIQRFYDAHPSLRPKTITVYRGATDKLIAFARKHRIQTVDDLDRRKLMMFREQIVNQPKHHNAAGGGRGAKRTERRAAQRP